MKRDMNLVRLLLLQHEGEEPTPDLSGFTDEQQLYHEALLIEAHLLDGQPRVARHELPWVTSPKNHQP